MKGPSDDHTLRSHLSRHEEGTVTVTAEVGEAKSSGAEARVGVALEVKSGPKNDGGVDKSAPDEIGQRDSAWTCDVVG